MLMFLHKNRSNLSEKSQTIWNKQPSTNEIYYKETNEMDFWYTAVKRLILLDIFFSSLAFHSLRKFTAATAAVRIKYCMFCLLLLLFLFVKIGYTGNLR